MSYSNYCYNHHLKYQYLMEPIYEKHVSVCQECTHRYSLLIMKVFMSTNCYFCGYINVESLVHNCILISEARDIKISTIDGI